MSLTLSKTKLSLIVSSALLIAAQLLIQPV